jgi:hypothetical protein
LSGIDLVAFRDGRDEERERYYNRRGHR